MFGNENGRTVLTMEFMQCGMFILWRGIFVIAAAVDFVGAVAEATGVAGEPGAVGVPGYVPPALAERGHEGNIN